MSVRSSLAFVLATSLATSLTLGCDDDAPAAAGEDQAAESDEPKTRAGKMYKQGKDGAQAAEAALNKKAEDILDKTANPE